MAQLTLLSLLAFPLLFEALPLHRLSGEAAPASAASGATRRARFLQKKDHAGSTGRDISKKHIKKLSGRYPEPAQVTPGEQNLWGSTDDRQLFNKLYVDGGHSDFETDGAEFETYNPAENNDIAQQFRKMDDLEPIAPLDTIDVAKRFQPGGYGFDGSVDLTIDDKPVPATGRGFSDAMYIPPYMRPDAFPNSQGERCICGYKDAKKTVVDRMKCNCTKTKAPDDFQYVKYDPLWNSSNFSVSPADMTYGDGNYWGPHIRGHVAAPADRLRQGAYPVQAPADMIKMVPNTAIKDRINERFARYIDQVEKRSRECDNVSPECTVECRPGDQVMLKAGNVAVPATVTNAHVPNAVTVEFPPGAELARQAEAQEAAEMAAATNAAPVPAPAPAPAPAGPSCPMSSACSAFEVCYQPGQMCVAQLVEQYTDFAGDIKHKYYCPKGFELCAKVEQMVVASYLTKDGKACRAGAPQPPSGSPPAATAPAR